MQPLRPWSLVCGLLLGACASRAAPGADPAEPPPAKDALVIGETFTIDSRALGETRRINVFLPTLAGAAKGGPLPVLYMPDGGVGEDFLHIVGLVQVSVGNLTMRPFMVVGVENTQRRRDMTGPTTNPDDRSIAPVVGGSAGFRRFLAEELVPAVRARYRTTDEAAIVGESLAGLFVLETFFLQPDLFDTYIAIDPSLWWADEALLRSAAARLAERPPRGKAVVLAHSDEPSIAGLTAQLSEVLAAHAGADFSVHYEPFLGESHATVYHPAALWAFRALFAPPQPQGRRQPSTRSEPPPSR